MKSKWGFFHNQKLQRKRFIKCAAFFAFLLPLAKRNLAHLGSTGQICTLPQKKHIRKAVFANTIDSIRERFMEYQT